MHPLCWFLYVPRSKIEPATMVDWDRAPTELSSQAESQSFKHPLVFSLESLTNYLFKGKCQESPYYIILFL